MPLSPRQRSLISRGTLLLVGIVLIYGGGRCWRVASAMTDQWRRAHPAPISSPNHVRDMSGAFYIYVAAFVLLVPGLISFALAVVPTRWLYRVNVAPVTHETYIPGPPSYF